jgi:hypothetical protein
LDPSLGVKLLKDRPNCLHLPSYVIRLKPTGILTCGPCFFRDGFITEIPTRVNTRVTAGISGTKEFDFQFIEHISVSVGLVLPEPGESLWDFRRKRSRRSRPSPKHHPVTSALWELVGKQPPLAGPLLQFCQGYNELQVADRMDLSLYNVTDRLRKAVSTGQKFLRV